MSKEALSDSVSCAVADKCGGCSSVNIPYELQLASKNKMMRELFDPLLKDSSARLLPIFGAANPFYYRNKVASPYAPGKRGPQGGREILYGMYEAGSHRIISAEHCLIENEQAQQVIRAIPPLMKRYKIVPYDENKHQGFLRYAVVRVGHESGEVLVTLVTNGEDFPASRNFCRDLVKKCPFITTIVQNINTAKTNTILGKRERRLYGPGFILDTLCGLSFKISSQSFYQVNSSQTALLYDEAVRLAGLTGTETVIDAYCGTGTIGLVAAKHGAAQVIGVDNVESAIHDARENAKHNGVENARFIVDDAAAFMQREAAVSGFGEGAQGKDSWDKSAQGKDLQSKDSRGKDLREKDPQGDSATADCTIVDNPLVDVVFMDPPRTGSSPEFLEALVTLSPRRIVYISCNPQTQVRDVAFLTQQGYKLDLVQPIDMFPHTQHIESIALLQKVSSV